MKALRIYAGPAARQHIEQQGLLPGDIGVIPAAAGGPKGLILGPLDRFIFGRWLAESDQDVHLVGASIGAWRVAAACLPDPVRAFERLEHDYVHQHYEPPAGQTRLRAQDVSAQFGQSLRDFFGGHETELIQHRRFRLHVLTSRGKALLSHEHGLLTPVGYALAFAANLVSRRAMGTLLERVVFSANAGGSGQLPQAPLPFDPSDYATRQVALSARNVLDVIQASCSIPFVLRSVQDIAGAPAGAYWDGGITDYHLHLNYPVRTRGLVLYPHFQRRVIPGWLDKSLTHRHRATPFLDSTVLLAPDPAWVATLPLGKLPDRSDFAYYGNDLGARVKAWQTAIGAAQQLADEFQQWLDKLQGGVVQGVESLR